MSDLSSGYFTLHNFHVEVRWDDTSVARAVRSILTYFGLTRRESVPGECHAQLSFLTQGSGSSLPDHARQIVQRNGITVWRGDFHFYVCEGPSTVQLDVASGTGRGILQSTPWRASQGVRIEVVNLVIHSLLILLRRRSVYPLHAAAVAKESTGLLLVGESDSGKSTQALSLAREGWDYLTDDSLLLHSGNGPIEARPLRRDFGLDQDAVKVFPEIAGHRQPFLTDERKRRIDMEAIYPGQRAERCTPRVLVFPSIVSQSESQIRPLRTTDAVCRLMRQSILLALNPRIARAHMNVLQRLADQARSYELLAGEDLEQNPSGVTQMLEPTLPCNGQERRTEAEG